MIVYAFTSGIDANIVSTPDNIHCIDVVVAPSLPCIWYKTKGLSPDGKSVNPIRGDKNTKVKTNAATGQYITIRLHLIDTIRR